MRFEFLQQKNLVEKSDENSVPEENKGHPEFTRMKNKGSPFWRLEMIHFFTKIRTLYAI